MDDAYADFLEAAFRMAAKYQSNSSPTTTERSGYDSKFKEFIKLIELDKFPESPTTNNDLLAAATSLKLGQMKVASVEPEPAPKFNLDSYEGSTLVGLRNPVQPWNNGFTRRVDWESTKQPPPKNTEPPRRASTTPYRPPRRTQNPWDMASWRSKDDTGGPSAGGVNVARAERRGVDLPVDDYDDDDEEEEEREVKAEAKGSSKAAGRRPGRKTAVGPGARGRVETFWGTPSIRRPKRKVVVEEILEQPTIKRARFQTARS